jgi:hypothetical protein
MRALPHLMKAEARLLRSAIISTALGLMVGALVGRIVSDEAIAQVTNCNMVEQGNFGNGGETVHDSDDGVFEDNRWAMAGGQDFGRSEVCGDGVDADRFDGQGESDNVGGGSDADTVDGGGGNDTVAGGTNSHGLDFLYGGIGSDGIVDVDGPDIDHLIGGDGPDNLNAIDQDGADDLNGGPGNDTCSGDGGDDESNCE